MRLVTYETDGVAPRIGLLCDNDTAILDLAAAHEARHGVAYEPFADMVALISAGAAALDRAREMQFFRPASALIPREGVRLLSPLLPPAQIRDCTCFEQHVRQAGASARRMIAATMPDPEAALEQMEKAAGDGVPPVFYQQPLYYKANRFSVTGHDSDVIWPGYSELMDFELELAVVIGRKCVGLTPKTARQAIFGYTIFNDFSARDAQMREMAGPLGPAKGKDFDGANALGPCIVTADEVPDPDNLEMIARVNGEEWARGSTADMHWSFEDVLCFISDSETLYPGEVIGSGTMGNGCGLEQMRFLEDGDVVELEVAGIGILRNRVIRKARDKQAAM